MDEENSKENREEEGEREEDPEPEPGKRFFKYHHLREGETKKKSGRMWTNTTRIITKRSLHPATQKVMIMYQLVGIPHSQKFTPLFSGREPRREGIPEESQSSHSSDSSSSTD